MVLTEGPKDLVFQSVRNEAPVRDGKILGGIYARQALILASIPKATWRAFRTSYAIWMMQAGANPKDLQAKLSLPKPLDSRTQTSAT